MMSALITNRVHEFIQLQFIIKIFIELFWLIQEAVSTYLYYFSNFNNNLYLTTAHGTFIGNLRLESNKPTQLPINSTFHFGASTRYYTLREKPTLNTKRNENESNENVINSVLSLPESEIELNVSSVKTFINKSFQFFFLTIRI